MGKKRKSKDRLEASELRRAQEPNPVDRVARTLVWANHAKAVMIDGVTYPAKKGWVDAWLLTHPSVGASRATRYIAALQAGGTVVERRVKPGTEGSYRTYQYRIA